MSLNVLRTFLQLLGFRRNVLNPFGRGALTAKNVGGGPWVDVTGSIGMAPGSIDVASGLTDVSPEVG